eukprot:6191289-Pleurochrysis_carterae.AAC.2
MTPNWQSRSCLTLFGGPKSHNSRYVRDPGMKVGPPLRQSSINVNGKPVKVFCKHTFCGAPPSTKQPSTNQPAPPPPAQQKPDPPAHVEENVTIIRKVVAVRTSGLLYP